MFERRFFPGLALALLLGAPGAGAAVKRPLSLDDLYRLDGPTAAVLSPDGKRLAFVRHWFQRQGKRERFARWLVEGSKEKARPAEKDEPDARAPVFSPDGKWLAFVSTRPRPAGWKQTPAVPSQSDPAVDVWLMPAAGGAAIPLAGKDKPHGRVFADGFFGRLAFSPDSKRLAFVADDGKDARSAEEKEANVEVVREDQGEGYTGYGPGQVWLAELSATPGDHAASRIERLTSDGEWYGDPHWSPDGKQLVVHANLTSDREAVRYSINKDYDLYAIDVTSRKRRRLTWGPGPEVSPRFSPDGKRLVCLSVSRKGTHRDVFDLAIVTLGESGPRTEIIEQAKRAPVFPLPEDCWDGPHHLVYRAEIGTGTEMVRVDVRTGKAAPLPAATREDDHRTAAGRRRLLYQLLPGSNAFLKERRLGENRVVTWDNKEGMKLEGILTTPPPGTAKPPYPLVLYPHGGPHSRSVLGFDFTVQLLAAHGYAVFQPNYRGSSGYGQKFIDADRFDFGGGDVRDILSGIDHLVKQKRVDPGRQYVYGTSYGGFLTCWLVGHTNQFRAAVAQNAVTDLDVMWGSSDIPSWTEWEFGGRPWEVPEAMRRHSPRTWAARVKTPTLILHSRDDRRCPLVMGTMFYRTLKARGVTTQMVIYRGEGHAIRQPRHREDLLRRLLAWFSREHGSGRER